MCHTGRIAVTVRTFEAQLSILTKTDRVVDEGQKGQICQIPKSLLFKLLEIA